jgi:lysophospholipase L1-like esterase
VLVGTLLPAGGVPLFDSGANARREQINRFIRMSGVGAGVVDFDAALRDPANTARLNPIYDSGDHLHPSSAGYKAMAAAVPLDRLRGSGC